MKALSTILAVACAALMVACGGKSKPKEEPVVRVVSKAKVLVDKLIACGDLYLYLGCDFLFTL